MGRLITYVAAGLCCVLASCGSREAETKAEAGENHVWKSQVQAIDRAREVEEVLSESARRQHQTAH